MPRKPVKYAPASYLFHDDGPPPKPKEPEAPRPPAPPDLSTPEGCTAAFAALYDRRWPKPLLDEAVMDLRDACVASGWELFKVEGFMRVAIAKSSWNFDAVDERHVGKAEAAAAEARARAEAARAKAAEPVPVASIDVSSLLRGPKPARGGPKPGLRGGIGK